MIVIMSATGRNNFKLAELIKEEIDSQKMESEIVNLESLNLDLYTPDREKDGVPSAAADLSIKLQKATGMVLLAPEYNGSIPPAVTNAIAWVSRTGDDWRSAFNEKFAVVGTHSGGGGHKVVSHLRGQLEHLGCNVLARPILTNFSKAANPDSLKTILGQLVSLTNG